MLGFVQSKPILEPKPKKPFPIVWLLLGSVFLVFVMYFSYQKSVKKDKNDQIVDISENQKQKFRADSLKLMNCVQYALIARNDGFYERCDGQGKVFLFKSEIYKYGVTCHKVPQNRYSTKYYTENNVLFVQQFIGHRAACEIEEKRKLYYYPALPENIKRPENQRLILPIGNCKTQ